MDWFLWVYAAVMAIDLLIPYLLARKYEGYSHRTKVMSLLGTPNSPVRRSYNIWLVLGGVLFAIGSVIFSLQYWAVSAIVAGFLLVLLLVFALGAMVLSGLFSVDETKDEMSLPAKIHGGGASIGFMALLFVPLVLAVLESRQKGGFSTVFCAVCFALGFLSFALFVMSDKPELQKSKLAQEGTWQRLTLFFLYLPIVFLIIKGQ